MTIDQIIEIISPYVNILGIVVLVTVLLSIGVKVYKIVKNTCAELSNTAFLNEQKIAEEVRKVLPEKMSVEIMPLVQSELKKINEQVQKATQLQAEKMNAKEDAIAKAIASMRSLSTEQREALLSIIDDDNKAEETQVVELVYNVSKEVAAMAEEKTAFEPDLI